MRYLICWASVLFWVALRVCACVYVFDRDSNYCNDVPDPSWFRFVNATELGCMEWCDLSELPRRQFACYDDCVYTRNRADYLFLFLAEQHIENGALVSTFSAF